LFVVGDDGGNMPHALALAKLKTRDPAKSDGFLGKGGVAVRRATPGKSGEIWGRTIIRL
jgi:hypothetical protein